MAGYIRPKYTLLTFFINLFQECRLRPSHSMIWSLNHTILFLALVQGVSLDLELDLTTLQKFPSNTLASPLALRFFVPPCVV